MKTDDNAGDFEIAIISMTGRFPGADDIDEFWRNLREGVDSVSFFSEEELKASGVGDDIIKDPAYVNAAAVLENIDLFDAAFFNFSPGEAETIDPQQRLFLECAWEVLEKAGYNAEIYPGLIGVYAGVGENTYLSNNIHPSGRQRDEVIDRYQLMVRNSKDFLCTRVSYKLDLKGPGVTVQTACSSSLVAVHLACQGLLNWECDMALAGGVSIRIPQETGYIHQKGMILSSDGRCRAFDDRADGMVVGNGLGVVLLKRLSDAISDGDCIRAIIKASAVNNDGSARVGYTAPGVEGQASVIAGAHMAAGVDPETITYIEAHGTGTELGDVVEIEALTQAFGLKTRKKGFCAIGSLKSNMGHLDAAAGVAGLIKTVLALEYGWIPPSLHFKKPNRDIDFVNSPFYVNDKLVEWCTEPGAPRRAGVSSFGIGGTNAHVVLEEAPSREESGEPRSCHLLLISAGTDSALEEAITRLSECLKQNPRMIIADVAYTLQVGRKHFNHRKCFVCRNINDAVAKLASGKDIRARSRGTNAPFVHSDMDKSPADGFRTESGLVALGKKWMEGAEIDWNAFYKNEKRYRIPLPTYPFERRRYWIEPQKGEASAKKPDIADRLHAPSWKRTVGPTVGPTVGKTVKSNVYGDSPWLIFLDESGFGRGLVEKLKRMGRHVITVAIGEAFAHSGEYEYTLDPGKEEDYESLCRSLPRGEVTKILHLWSVESDYDSNLTTRRFDKALKLGFYSLLFLARAFAARRVDRGITIVAVSNHVHEVIGEERLRPEKATLLGPVKTIPLEHRNMICRGVDIVLPESGSPGERMLIDNLLAEFATNAPDAVIAYRNKYRWVQTLEPVRPEASDNWKERLREKGVYLITGGPGSVGMTLAGHLAKTVKARLILAGGSTLPGRDRWDDWLMERGEKDGVSRKINKIKKMEKAGAEVSVIGPDAANPGWMLEAAERAVRSYGRIDGVIHSAGMADNPGAIREKTKKTTEEAPAPPMDGAILLSGLVEKYKPDFFLLFSDPTSVHRKRPFDRAAHVALNEFFDAFAHYNSSRNDSFVTSVDWEARPGDGAVAGAARETGGRKEAPPSGDSHPESVELFNRILGEAIPRIIISGREPMAADNTCTAPGKETSHSRPELAVDYISPGNETERILCDIWQTCLGIEKIGVNDDFFQLGGDSLSGTQVMSRIRERFGMHLNVEALFEDPTVATFSRHIEDIRRKTTRLKTLPGTDVQEGRRRVSL